MAKINPNSSDLLVKHITSSEPDPNKLQDLLELSISVFKPLFPTEVPRPSSFEIEEWQRRIAVPNAVIYYVTTSTSDEPLGFFFSSPRKQHQYIGDDELRQHIWLVAIKPEYQGIGIFPVLMDTTKRHARDCGFREITVGTRPTVLKKMYRLLGQHGWQEVAWDDQEGWPWVLFKTAL